MDSGGRDKPIYRRVLLKISGEALQGDQSGGIHPEVVRYIAGEIKSVVDLGVQIAVVIGGGNIFRGLQASAEGMDRVAADQMGMLATVINALALQDYLERQGIITRVMSAIQIEAVAEPFILRRAVRHLEKDRVVIFASGTGNPFFTTDTAAALRATEIKAELLLKGTKVEGVYSADPEKDTKAVLYKELTYMKVIQNELGVMDLTAVTISKDNNIPIRVFNIRTPGNLRKIVMGEEVGTMVGE